MRKMIGRLTPIVVIGIALFGLVCSAIIAEAVVIRSDAFKLISPPCENFQGVSAAGNAPLKDTNTTGGSGPIQVVYSTTHQLEDFDAGDNWSVGASDVLEWCFDDGSSRDAAFMVMIKTSSSLDNADFLDQLTLFNDGVQVFAAGDLISVAASAFHPHYITPIRIAVTPGTCVDVRYDSAGIVTHSTFNYSALFRQVECHDKQF